MSYLQQLSQVDKYSNALDFIQKVLMTELGQCTLVMMNSLALADNQFQLSNYCNDDYCPNYNSAELLRPTNKLRIFRGEFIKQWKLMSTPQRVFKEDCIDLFQDDLRCYHDILVLPILLDLKVERWILVLKSANAFATLDLAKLLLLANFAVISLARTEEQKQLQEITNWREQELKEIARLQRLLLPDEGTSIPGIELAFKFQVYKEAGGDYFDIGSLSKENPLGEPHRFGAIIADVTGHGPSAAVEAAMLDAILRTYKPNAGVDSEDPAAVLNYVNTHFFTRKTRGKFITAMAFAYDPILRRIRYACAGHPYGYIKRGDSLLKLDQGNDIPIGVLKEYQWTNHDITIYPNDIVFVYTDVALETRNPQQQAFGFDRLEKTLKDAQHCPHCLVDDVASVLTAFSESDELEDDLTLCAIEIFL